MIGRRLAGAAVLASMATATSAAPLTLTIDTADGPRHALVVASVEGPRPTVLVLHGALGTAANTLRSSGFAEAAAKRGFVAVFPDGHARRWNDGRAGGVGGVDDVAFLRALVARLVADQVAQADRIYIVGISNGGMMSLAMMCEASALFAGIGTVIASMPAGLGPCELKPVPVVMINGTADPVVPYRGGAVGVTGGRGRVESVEQTIDRFRSIDGCDPTPVLSPIAPSDAHASTSVVRVAWPGCVHATTVTLYRIDGGGHAFPGLPALLGGMLGPSSPDVDVADAILDAFTADGSPDR